MAVNNVIARMYDAGPSKVISPATDSENGFAETVQAAVADQVEKQDCCCCNHTGVTAAPTVNPATATDTDGSAGEVRQSAMFKFTLFVRISSDFGAVQDSLADKFKEATRQFVTALKEDSDYDLPVLDSYLGNADASAAKGLQSSKSFLDNILAAADSGLKSIVASMSGSSWMSGLNMSGNTGGLTSVSPVDIAKIHLQNSLNTSSTATSGGGAVSYSSGHQLELIRGIADPVKVDADGKTAADAAVKVDDSEAGQAAVDRLVRRDRILDRFLQLIDDLSSGAMGGASVTRAAFSFSYNGKTLNESTEAGEAIGDAATDKQTLQQSTESSDAVEEIIT